MSSSRNEGRWSRDNSVSNVSATSGASQSNRLSAASAAILRGKRTPRGSQSSDSERRSGSMLKNFLAQRNTDYRTANAPPTAHYSQGTPRTTAARRPSSGRSSPPPDQSDVEEEPFFPCGDYFRPSPGFLHALSVFIGSPVWRVVVAFNSFLLLFGSEVQELWIPPEGDLTMNVLYCLGFAVFSMDMIMRCFLDPKYVQSPRCRNNENAQNSAWGRCQLGSFLFWCDLVSTLAFMYSISFIHSQAFAIQTIDISLNDIGIPVSFVESLLEFVDETFALRAYRLSVLS